jgi:hypothetical protein
VSELISTLVKRAVRVLCLLWLVACQMGIAPAAEVVQRTVTVSPPATPTSTSSVGELVPTASPVLPTATPTPVSTPTRLVIPTGDPSQPHVRIGFGISTSAQAAPWAQRMGASWYLDWRAADEHGNAPEHWKTVRVTAKGYQPSLAEIRKLAVKEPGHVWILGNEPDVIWQDNIPPEDYARAYGELYDTIKRADPSALIAVAGVAQGTPLRFQYLDRVVKAYQELYGQPLPADWWTVHGYVLREERKSWGVEIPPGIEADQGILYEISDHGRLDFFEKQLRDFRAWMQRNGYQGTPLALTEFGILMPGDYGFPPEFVVQYLHDTFDLLSSMRDEATGYPADDYHLIQRWAWFSLADPNYPTSDLADLENDRLTLVGEAFRDYVNANLEP